MEFLAYLYLTNGVLMGLSFMTQIAKLSEDDSGAASISLLSCILWTFVSLINVLYGTLIVQDTFFIIFSSIVLAGNGGMLGMVIYKRYVPSLSIKITIKPARSAKKKLA